MNKMILAPALLLCASMLLPAVSASAQPGNPLLPKYEYKLKDVMKVDGRQGVACDGKYLYVSDSKKLFKYDLAGNLVAKNENPFEGYKIPSNHIGDIDVYNGELYISAENFADGVGKDIQIAVHDAETMKLVRTFAFAPESGQEEVSGITVDRVRKTVWMCSWVGEESGRHLYEYSLEGQFLRKLHVAPVPQWVQGVYAHDGALFLTADDGTADDNEPDSLYRVDITSATSATLVLEKKFNEVLKEGEIEGLCVDPNNGDLLVLFNRGMQIVLGMTKGCYPGYTGEVHEIYRYAMAPKGGAPMMGGHKAPKGPKGPAPKDGPKGPAPKAPK